MQGSEHWGQGSAKSRVLKTACASEMPVEPGEIMCPIMGDSDSGDLGEIAGNMVLKRLLS